MNDDDQAAPAAASEQGPGTAAPGRGKRGRPPKNPRPEGEAQAPPKKKRKSTEIPIDYKVVAALAQVGCTDEEIAIACGMGRSTFTKRKSKDLLLQQTLDENFNGGKISLRRAQMKKALDRYLTICKECGKITVSVTEFLPSCPYCDEELREAARDHAEAEGKELSEEDLAKIAVMVAHNEVKHKFVPGDVAMQIWLGKQLLGQVDKVEHKEDANTERIAATFAGFMKYASDRKKAKEDRAKTKTKAIEPSVPG